MNEKRKQRILLQLDADAQPSTFDAVVAVDAHGRKRRGGHAHGADALA